MSHIHKNFLLALLSVSIIYPTYGSGSPYYSYGSGSSSNQGSGGYPPSYGQGGSQQYPYQNPHSYSGYGQGGSSGSTQGSGYPPGYGQGGSQQHSYQGPSGYGQGGSSGSTQGSGYPPSYGHGGYQPYSYHQPQAPSSYGQSGSSSSGQSSGTYPQTSSAGAPSSSSAGAASQTTPPKQESGQVVQPPRPTQGLPIGTGTQSPERPKSSLPPIKPTGGQVSTSTSSSGPGKSTDKKAGPSDTPSVKPLPSTTQHGKEVISDAFTKQKTLGDEDIKDRVDSRTKARKVQANTKAFRKGFLEAMEHVKFGGKIVSGLAAASGDPHAKMAAAALNVGLMVFEQLGDKTALFVIGAARFYERSQEIISNTEVLIEDAVKLQEKIKVLERSVKDISEANKTPAPSQSSSVVTRVVKDAGRGVIAAKNKVSDFIDPFTNEKAKREAKLKEVQSSLASEKREYDDIIKLLEIKILQESIKEINRKINIETTIADLRYETEDVYKAAIANISKNKSKAKRQLKQIEEKRVEDLENLNYYLQYQLKPTETPEQLTSIRDEISNKISDIAKTTKLSDSRYLQGRVAGINITSLDASTVAAIYREIDAIQNTLMKEIDRLNSELDESDETASSEK